MSSGSVLLSFQILGLAGLVAGVVAWLRNRRAPRTTVARTASLGVGALLAAVSICVSYPLDASHRIVGFPFMVAVFEKSGTHWQDFVGPLTVPAYLGNALFALMLPQIVLLAWRWRERRIALPNADQPDRE